MFPVIVENSPTADTGVTFRSAGTRRVQAADGQRAVIGEPHTLHRVVLAQLEAVELVSHIGNSADKLARAGAGHEGLLLIYIRVTLKTLYIVGIS